VMLDPVPEIDRNGIITQCEVEFDQITFNDFSTAQPMTDN